MNHIIKVLYGISLLIFLLALASCSGGGGESEGSQEPAADLSGKWDIQEIIYGDCLDSAPAYPVSYLATVVQTGHNFTVSFATYDGMVNLDGTISGSSINFSGNHPGISHSGIYGTQTLSFTGTVSADGLAFRGTAPWSLTDESSSCGGIVEINATMLGKTGEEPAVNLSGLWDAGTSFLDCQGYGTGGGYTNYTAIIVQTNNDLEISYFESYYLDLTYAGSGTISGLSTTWNVSQTAGGGSNGISFLGTVSNDGDSISGYKLSESEEPCPKQVYATRLSSGTPAAWEGTWTSETIEWGTSRGSLDMLFTLNGTDLEGLIQGHDIPQVFMGLNLKGSINGNDIVFSDVDDQATFTGTINGNMASGTYTSTAILYPFVADTGTWEATRIVP